MKPILKVDKNIFRVYRGGSWYNSMLFARVADRDRRTPCDRLSLLGFRLFEGRR